MNIACTNKLQSELKIKPSDAPEELPLYTWYANFLTIHRKKAVLLFNSLTRYSVLMFGLKAADFKKINEIINQSIRDTFLAEGILPEVVDEYFKAADQITFVKTSNRSVLTAMNQVAWMTDNFEEDDFDFEKCNQLEFNLRMGAWYFKVEGEYQKPHDMLIEALLKMLSCNDIKIDKEIISIHAYQFLAKLNLQNHTVWRRFVVPSNITFRKLHFVMQDVFGWGNSHLYAFSILDNEKLVARTIVSLEDADEDERYPQVVLDRKTSIAKYIPQYTSIAYEYDFGDGWEHNIVFEKSVMNYNKRFAVCLEGEGNCPPEDVGGEEGYDHFLDAIGNPQNPEHDDLLEWGKMQEYRDFNFERINYSLQHSLYN